ncbi:MAG: anhydro-N-acetylmuramic acid kinase [Clostridia bacterium]|nr:anhydro-N-acetylmuramic acid kinase [Clostridia bacterium]
MIKDNNKNIYIGLMSGTSADGIDAAAVEISGGVHPKCKLLAFENTPYPAKVREMIFDLFDTKNATADKISRMNFLLGELYGNAVNSLIEKHGICREDVAVIGSHGQTVYHEPIGETPNTLQIGEGSVIARLTGIPCVSDFRTADIAAGGNGAPLVPFTEYALFGGGDKSIVLQNIGGIANSTILKAGCAPDEVFAFDNGPGNMIIDCLMGTYFGEEMDYGGKQAAAGKVNAELLEKLLSDPYYKKAPPKTTGREMFGKEYCQSIAGITKDIPKTDVITTVTALTATVIANSYRDFIEPVCKADELIVGGGGSYNPTLMGFLKAEMEKYNVKVFTQEDKGQSSDAKEAVAFALLAYYTIQGLPSNLPSATGAKYPAILGKISL